MRKASVSDIWSDLKKGKGLQLYLKELNFENVENIKTGIVNFNYGINVICGPNGVGKSTILESINYVLTYGKFEDKLDIFLRSKLTLEMFYRGEDRTCNTEDIGSLSEWFESETMIKYIQTGSSVNCMSRFKKEKSIEEYFDSTEEELFTKRDLENISRIIGKDYDSCKAYMIEENMLYESMPFFIVNSNGIEYDTRNMGVGEHSVIYIYYYLKNMNNSILLLEEPENFIPPYSQRILTQVIGRLCVDNKLNIILTTHSNHILQEIPEENIILLRRNTISGDLIIDNVQDQSYLKPLGLECAIEGYLLMEDVIAKLYCSSIIKNIIPQIYCRYKFISVNGGCTEISSILKSFKSKNYEFNIIGVFDGDMNNEAKRKEFDVDKYQWKYTYLPYADAIEDVFRQLLNSEDGLEICSRLQIEKKEFLKVLSDTQMYEKHDWILEVAKGLKVHIETLIDIIVKYEIENDKEGRYDEFKKQLLYALQNKN
ncbi:ATP-dependent nuclease [Clostridium beijerinckii]|uniref:ATP-dependent nuclease n=1 Tax=Clostridium beijerinckii TaxID=1520 RepID=UPI00242A64D7|nr:ATP-binding protein [Clostridium beijerinckii]MDG5855649.1 AAA family ATPase [Clostridium beijerinckii]